MIKEKEHSFKRSVKDFFSGSVAGISGILIGYPFDTLKVKMQLETSKSVWSISKQFLSGRNWLHLFDGVMSPISSYSVIVSINFGGYAIALREMSKYKNLPIEQLRPIDHAISGLFSGVPYSLSACPFEQIKIVMQAHSTDGKPKYRNTFHCAKEIFQQKGILGFYKGIVPNLGCQVFGCFCYFGSYNWIKDYMSKNNTELSFSNLLIAGGLTGVFTWFAIFPFDVMRTKLMNDAYAEKRKYTGFFDCLSKNLKNEGPKFLYRGLTVTLIRAFPVNAVMLAVNDLLLELLD
eukprot:TRINITY_DN13688_c0_g1_i1.p1 TRINITY_DN13688_c0_g1~~TRINITY_DN13688_c0_g1_i1.p1  ORF type:complete len:291 (-),score=65.13 TRINITY_DN13688_c0_g1_i1:47-919(-)